MITFKSKDTSSNSHSNHVINNFNPENGCDDVNEEGANSNDDEDGDDDDHEEEFNKYEFDGVMEGVMDKRFFKLGNEALVTN